MNPPATSTARPDIQGSEQSEDNAWPCISGRVLEGKESAGVTHQPDNGVKADQAQMPC